MKVIGIFLRDLRRENGWTLSELAERTNLSIGFLSQVERGLAGFSMSSLSNVCKAFNMSISEFFARVDHRKPGAFLSNQAIPDVTENDQSYVNLFNGSSNYRFLSKNLPNRTLEIFLREIPKGYRYPKTPHEGEEFGYVLEGHLKLNIGESAYVLGPGESYHILSTIPHACETSEAEGAKVLYVQTMKYDLGPRFGNTDLGAQSDHDEK